MTQIPYITGFNAYLKTRKISPRAHDEYLNSLHDFMDYLVVHNQEFKVSNDVVDIHDVDMLEYKNFLENELSFSPSTINKILSNLNVYFKYLFSNRKTPEIPTLDITSLKVPTQDNFPTEVFLNLDEFLNDSSLHVYSRLLVLGISKGYSYKEVLANDFYRVFEKLHFTNAEKKFLHEYDDFIAPWRLHWNNQNLFLSRNNAAKSPLLSVAALHRNLKEDSEKTGYELTPKKLYTTYVLILLSQTNPSKDQQAFIEHLSTSSLLYYRRLLRETEFEI